MQYSTFFFDRKKLINNLKSLGTKNICAMVKANAYGVGLEPVCKALFGKVKFFGVANMSEAMQIRKFDMFTNILIVGITDDFLLAMENNISITIDNLNQLENIDKTLKDFELCKKIKIHIKINSGMNRLGINNKQEIRKCLKIIKNNKKIIFEGFYTHFASISDDILFFNKQFKKFQYFCKLIPPIFNPIIHLGGGDILGKINADNFSEYMFRVGLNLYKNVVKIESKIIKISTLKESERLGYSNGYIAHKPTKVALIPLGYADGINRKLGNFGSVKINGKKCAIIGNICMDMFFVDISNVKCKLNDKVEVLSNPIAWAKICETIPYEILTSLNYKRMNYKII